MMCASGKMSMSRFIRADLAELGGYLAHKAPETLSNGAESIVKLDANENPYGCAPGVYRALAECRGWHIYPDAAQRKLRERIGTYVGLPAKYIVAGTGSGEVLDDMLCLLLEPGDEVINCTPTFDLYRLRTQINRGRLVNVPRRGDFSLDVPAVKAVVGPRTKLIVIANPNNPTGNITPEAEIISLIETGVPVLVDEAYYEFCGETVAPLVRRFDNLMVLRTFSKWAGLAGIRTGYGVFPPEITGYLLKIKMPYNLTVPAAVAVNASLDEREYLEARVRDIIAERERLYLKLTALDWLEVYPSRANYIFCRMRRGSAKTLCENLQEKGILIRRFDQPGLENCFRASVGKPEDTDRLLSELTKLKVEQ